MATISVDFDVFKALTNLRATEEETENAVLRKLLKLPPVAAAGQQVVAPAEGPALVTKGVTFPPGTKLRATFKGAEYTAQVEKGAIWVSGTRHTSPSSAAYQITKSGVNGWTFWECQLPGATQWKSINALRKAVAK
jgi:hypothetical protein